VTASRSLTLLITAGFVACSPVSVSADAGVDSGVPGSDAGVVAADAGAACAPSCRGCCLADGTCLPGGSNGACGGGGVTCALCAATQTCASGVCTKGSCPSTNHWQTCGYGRTCGTTACESALEGTCPAALGATDPGTLQPHRAFDPATSTGAVIHSIFPSPAPVFGCTTGGWEFNFEVGAGPAGLLPATADALPPLGLHLVQTTTVAMSNVDLRAALLAPTTTWARSTDGHAGVLHLEFCPPVRLINTTVAFSFTDGNVFCSPL